MRLIRKGNDIGVVWSIFANQGGSVVEYSLQDRNISLFLETGKNKYEIKDFTIVGEHYNSVKFTFWGKDQIACGAYFLTMVENKGEEDMRVLDFKDAFAIVRHSWETGGEDNPHITTEVVELSTNIGDIIDERLIPDTIARRTDFADYLPLDGSSTMTGSLDMGDNKITNVANPTSDYDATNKKYVDDGIAALDGTITLSNPSSTVTQSATQNAGTIIPVVSSFTLKERDGKLIEKGSGTTDSKVGTTYVDAGGSALKALNDAKSYADTKDAEINAKISTDASSSNKVMDKAYIDGKDAAINAKISSDASSSNKVMDKAYIDGKDAAINAKIPSAASSSNQLADKAWVRAVNDLTNYYTKSQTYTKTEVNNIIGSLDQFKYEIYSSLSDITSPQTNVLYLIGPKSGTSGDMYEEYVYSNGWVKIGDTSIDLSGYMPKSGGTFTDDVTMDTTKALVTDYIRANANGAVDFNGDIITNIGDPIEDGDAAPKGYVDDALLDKANNAYSTVFEAGKYVCILVPVQPSMVAAKRIFVHAPTSNGIVVIDFLVRFDRLRRIYIANITAKYLGNKIQYLSDTINVTVSGGYAYICLQNTDIPEHIHSEGIDITSVGNIIHSVVSSLSIVPGSIVSSCTIEHFSDVFIATYGVDSFSDVYAEYQAGKMVICNYTDTIFVMTDIDDDGGTSDPHGINFSAAFESIIATVNVDATNGWSYDEVRIQEELVSGTNIKTINGTSLLGSENIPVATPNDLRTKCISAGNGGASLFVSLAGESDKYYNGFRIDMAGKEGDSEDALTGSLLVTVHYDENSQAHWHTEAYYYGVEMSRLIDNVAIYSDDGNYYIAVTFANMTYRPVNCAVTSLSNDEPSLSSVEIDEQTLIGTITPTVIGGGSSDVFWATYGSTTYQQIVDAYNAGKLVACRYNNNNYTLITLSNAGSAWFGGAMGAIFRLWCNISDSSWGADTYYTENSSNRQNSMPANPDNYHYLSTKAVADALGKMGVISQTQTWSGPIGWPTTYQMSDLVYGVIPQANIDLFESAGAVFNATSGYFELNDLTDLSYTEMRAIYTYAIRSNDDINLGGFISTLRTTLALSASSGTLNTSWAFANAHKYETFRFSRTTGTYTITPYGNWFVNCYYLRKVMNRLSITRYQETLFQNCNSLEDLQITGLAVNFAAKDCPRLTAASVAYMITNAGTATITITLHATAYARATADASVQAALQSKTNVSLASA